MAKKPRPVDSPEAPRRPDPTPRKARPVEAQGPAWWDRDWIGDSLALLLGLMAAWIPRPVETGLRDLFQLPKLFSLTTWAAIGLGLVAALAMMGRRLRWPSTPLLIPAAIFLLAVIGSLGIAAEETGGVLSIFAKMDAYRWVAAGVVFVLALVALDRPGRLVYVLVGLAVGGIWVSIIGIFENYGMLDRIVEQPWNIISKPGSTFGNRNMAAEHIIAVLPAAYVACTLAVVAWQRGRLGAMLSLLGGGGAAGLVMAFYLKLTITRSAWIGAFLGVVVTGFLWMLGLAMRQRALQSRPGGVAEDLPVDTLVRPTRAFHVRLATLVLGSVVSLVVVGGTGAYFAKKSLEMPTDDGDTKRTEDASDLAASVLDTKQEAATSRFMMWSSSWEAVKAHPLGRGAGNWRVLFPQYVTQREDNKYFSIDKQPTRSHNDYLQFASEFGLHGLAAFLVLIGMAMWLFLMTVRAGPPPLVWMTSGASLAGIVGILGDAVFSFPLQLPAPTFFFALHLGTIGACHAMATRRYPEAGPLARAHAVWLRAALVAFAAAALGFVFWENPRLTEAEKGFTEARALQRRGKPVDALAAVDRAVAINGDDFQNHFIRALCLADTGKLRASVQALDASLRLYPNLLNAWVNRALFAIRIPDDALVEESLERALALKPDDITTLNIKSSYLFKKGRADQVETLLSPFLERHPRNTTLLNNMGAATQRQKKYDASAGYFERALEVDPHNVEYHQNLAKIRTLQGKHEAAVDHYRLSAEMKASKVEFKRTYAAALARVGRWPQAKHECEVALGLSPKEHGALLREMAGLESELTDAVAKAELTELLAWLRGHPFAKK